VNRDDGFVKHKDLEDEASVMCRLFVCLFVWVFVLLDLQAQR
jgi:hypothetical protein